MAEAADINGPASVSPLFAWRMDLPSLLNPSQCGNDSWRARDHDRGAKAGGST
jgi:hypothetical protein